MPIPTVLHGDCLEVMAGLEPESFDALVTDPPAGIAFMGKEWDTFTGNRPPSQGLSPAQLRADTPAFKQRAGTISSRCNPAARGRFVDYIGPRLEAARRLLKPGAFGLVWAIPKTSHWTACAIEDAGFEIRDRVAHIFGTGFPKNKNSLKPAVEDWWLVRVPGPLRELGVDGCRVKTGDDLNGGAYAENGTPRADGWGMQRAGAGEYVQPPGRWPPNLVMSHHPDCRRVGTRRVKSSNANFVDSAGSPKKGTIGPTGLKAQGVGVNGYADDDGTETIPAYECVPTCPIRLMDEQTGDGRGGGGGVIRRNGLRRMEGWALAAESVGAKYADSGTASRFFPNFEPDPEYPPWFDPDYPRLAYVPKASRGDRNENLPDGYINTHPTVKSQQLMRWLCKLVTPPGGRGLDPFAGSGSTLVAAEACGFDWVGVEADPKEYETARLRVENINRKTPLFGLLGD